MSHPRAEEHGDVAGWARNRVLHHDIFDAVAGEITHRDREWTGGRVKAALRLERAVAEAQKYRDVARVVVGDDDVGDAVAGEVRDDDWRPKLGSPASESSPPAMNEPTAYWRVPETSRPRSPVAR